MNFIELTNSGPLIHITLIDNMEIVKEFDQVIFTYPFILEQNDFTTKSFYLITLYPKIRLISLNKNNIFTEFKKIIHNPKCINICNIYHTLFTGLIEIIKNNNNTFEIDIIQKNNDYITNIDLLLSYSNVKLNIILGHEISTYYKIPIYHDINWDILKDLIESDNKDDDMILNGLMFLMRTATIEPTKYLYMLIRDYLLNISDKELNNKAFFVNHHFKKFFDLKKVITNSLEEQDNITYFTIKNLETYNFENKEDRKLSRKIFNKINVSNYKIKIDESVLKFSNENRDNNDDMFLNSCEFFSSSITLNNWFEELQNNSCLGLLTKYNRGQFQHISMSFLSVSDYIEMAIDHFNKQPCIKFGDIEVKDIITGMAIGECNAVIPLYINKYHWKNVKVCLESLLGIIISYNPMLYCPSYQSLYFVLFEYFTQQLFDKNNILNEKFIKIFIAVYRTCAEICFENKYNHGIRKLIEEKEYSNINHIKIFSQIITTGYILSNNQISELISTYSNQSKDINLLTSLYNFYKLNRIFDTIIKDIGSYSKLIKMIDMNYGLIDDEFCQKIIKLVIKDTKILSTKELFDKLNFE